MYILVVGDGLPNGKTKSPGLFAYDQAKALSDLGHKVVYAVLDLRSIRRGRRWGIVKKNIDGISIYQINIPVGSLPIIVVSHIAQKALSFLYNIIKKEQGIPEIIHAHFSVFCGYASIKIKNEDGVKLVVTEHSSQLNKHDRNQINKSYYKIAKYVYECCDELISVSESLSRNLKRNFNVSPITISNIVDVENFKFNERVIKTRDNTFVFVSVGNLIKHKRMDNTVKAFYQSFKQNKDVQLIITGEGPEKGTLLKLIKSLNMENQIILTGYQDRKKIAEFFHASDCFVLSSISETFGVSYIEAMAAGLPVISTKCGGPEEFINEDNGKLVSIDDIDSLAIAMDFMYKNAKNYDQKKISQSICERYSPNNIALKLTKLFSEL